MTIRVALHHDTHYRYERPIMMGPQLVRLRPAYHGRTRIDAYGLRVKPAEHYLNWQQDPFANPVARLVFPGRTREFRVTVDLIAEMTVINPFDFFVEESAESWPFRYDEATRAQLAPYLARGEQTPLLAEWADSLPKSAERTIDFLVEANRRAEQRVEYLVRLEPGVQTPEETLAIGSGSCRDSAWLMVETFRRLGLAARFVSGYLIQLAEDVPPLEGPPGPTRDFCDLHAWTEVFLPGAGWVGLDPTSGLFAGEGHIPLACTPTFTDAAPITGGHEPCEAEFLHEMSVTRVHETPRVTKPYTEGQWSEILRAGRAVDAKLEAQDVRLTIGGEPTFVSVDNMDDPQWNSGAVGEEKRVLSNLLLLRLRDRFAPGGLLHYGQGKWYPGESLPRWALTCMWRTDGEPVWNDPRYLADEGKNYGYGPAEAGRFLRHLCDELGVSARMSLPVFEDAFHYLWRENRLPIDVEPTDPKLDDPNERAMMMRAFSQGLSRPVGFVLPLRRAWWQARGASPRGWISSRWPVRSDRLFLIPGDSPIGLRLPLDSLPGDFAAAAPYHTMPMDPTVPREPLPKGNELAVRRDDPTTERMGIGSDAIREQHLDAETDDTDGATAEVVTTALCVEVRHGRLSVFMPPTQRLEDYLDLVHAVEQTCAALDMPVILEGYLPPPDPRLRLFKVTPDPGVIEVNTQPSASWDELVDLTETLYEEAARCRLGTEKFDLDGHHTGTGGGNHIVLGGGTPSDSPFLRRPDLLASMLRFWNNHPSLSYLFSGRFVGPTSQAPRFDEARQDSVYEMELALSRLPRPDDVIPPWLVDRLFRDLLVDVTGNTHRSEFCIDKLYSPDSVTGRLGLVELRGFEMPPHARMSLAQQLLVRAAIAVFWERPYEARLIDWGTAIHDRFMLPHFVWADFCDVIRELCRSGIELSASWYATHHEFRFPKIGEVTYQGVRLELRSAIEPWYVLGEDPAAGGTARYVDSSLERMQVLLEGFEPERYALLCAGRRVPLHDAGAPGRYVAGIRFRAWQPPRCLHPTIGIHTPLHFDLVDRRAGQSIGGCTYHAVHPAGIAFERFPINANEAESRRGSRFERRGGLGGAWELGVVASDPGPNPFPLTLDLRRAPPEESSRGR